MESARAGSSDVVRQLATERAAFAATLRAVGPDAPTLAGSWTTRDLAAHVAATEQTHGVPTFVGRSLVSRYGLRLNDTFRPAMAIDLRRFRRHGFDWAVRRLERPAPRLLNRPSVLPVSVFEIFVHHEDVRRPNGLTRSEPPVDFVPSITWLLRYQRRLLHDVVVRVVLPDGREIRTASTDPTLTVRGTAGEVLLWLAGRQDVAAVTVEQPGSRAAAPRLGV